MSIPALLGLVFALALLLSLHLRVSGLPVALAALVRKERAQEGGALLDTMKEAVAVRSGQAVVAIQTYQEQIVQSLRAQIADAETRARVAERRAADAATALEAASILVRELRVTLEAAAELLRVQHASEPRPAEPSTPSTSADGDEGERKTTELPAGRAGSRGLPRAEADDGGFDDEDETTKVADRTGILVAFRRTRRSPTVLPPAPGHDGGDPRPPGGDGAA